MATRKVYLCYSDDDHNGEIFFHKIVDSEKKAWQFCNKINNKEENNNAQYIEFEVE